MRDKTPQSTKKPITCALVGYGYWGRNVAKALQNSPDFELCAIYDEDRGALSEANALYGLTHFKSYEAILDSDIQALFIVTPPQTHYTLAKKALESGKHTFVEKPLTTDYAEAQSLYELSESRGYALYCDHIFLHSPAVEYLKAHLHELGEIVYINARRINLGLFQSNADVIWDLAIHDLSIIDYLVGLEICEVSTFAARYQSYPNDALANINLRLKNGMIITLNLSWLSPVKVREMIIGGSNKMAVYDETKRDKITIFDSGVVVKECLDKPSLYQKLVEYKLGGEFTPKLSHTLALDNSIAYFASLLSVSESSPREIKGGREHVLRVIRAIELIQKARG